MSAYERELKGILSGDEKVLSSVSRSLDEKERLGYASTMQRPFLVVRAAGSLGVDLVAVRGATSLVIEVKAGRSRDLRFSRSVRLVEQLDELRAGCQRASVLPIYAFRLKGVRGDSWRLFSLPGLAYEGRAGLLYARLPVVEETAAGNPVLRWGNGMPLARFLDYLQALPA